MDPRNPESGLRGGTRDFVSGSVRGHPPGSLQVTQKRVLSSAPIIFTAKSRNLEQTHGNQSKPYDAGALGSPPP